jgi:hypothetical protein
LKKSKSEQKEYVITKNRSQKRQLAVDRLSPPLLQSAAVMGQQLRKRVKRQRRDARNKRVKERMRAEMKK